ncbi:DUF6283 family protein [Paracoccus sp. DMF-8]|uniref:DUF6283 family protein n=1 Tax=Paracoccus sp. DMF-8 TaxID=3019445 RepID=UPI0023E3F341|nr:DUF6283 family protein [Paracoccus sp. DMF-8]MDF3607572.1 DUF6283 family protein [Paracoccus sp. DMF-8]
MGPEEYAKLPAYDRETWQQPLGLFMCHQKDGCLCGGWLMAHDRDELLALRLHGRGLAPEVWDYAPDVPVFASGAEAAAHGLSGVGDPSPAAQRKIAGLMRQQARRGRMVEALNDEGPDDEMARIEEARREAEDP